MQPNTRSTLCALALFLWPTSGLAWDEEDPDFDDDFFEEVSQDKAQRAERSAEAIDAGGLEGDLIDDEFDADPEWDAPAEPEIIDDMEDPPDDMESGPSDFDEDPPDDFSRPTRAPAAAPKPAAAPAGPQRLSLKVADKEPLSGAFEPSIVAIDVDAIVVELPILVATSGSQFSFDAAGISTEVFVAGKAVAKTTQTVNRASVADLGPTILWPKMHIPVTESKGTLEFRVSSISEDGAATELFTKSVDYRL